MYDADGNTLLQKDPGQTTLFIFGEQLALNTASGAVTGTRFLALPGGGTVARTGAGSNYSFEITDLHGTSLLALDSTCDNPVWRQETPFGAPRSTATGPWPDTNGFLGKPTDSSTGLTIVGARNYDPAIGRFISIDPVLESSAPQQLNGYTYAGDNPVTQSDPSGLMICDGSVCGSIQWVEHVAAVQYQQQVVAYQRLASYVEGQNLDRCEYRGGCLRCRGQLPQTRVRPHSGPAVRRRTASGGDSTTTRAGTTPAASLIRWLLGDILTLGKCRRDGGNSSRARNSRHSWPGLRHWKSCRCRRKCGRGDGHSFGCRKWSSAHRQWHQQRCRFLSRPLRAGRAGSWQRRLERSRYRSLCAGIFRGSDLRLNNG